MMPEIRMPTCRTVRFFEHEWHQYTSHLVVRLFATRQNLWYAI